MSDFLDRVHAAMEAHFGADHRRIAHARQVAAFAGELLAYIDADPTITLTAAYLHDVGIPEAERRYGSCAGPHQEQLGPPIARAILERLESPPGLVEVVCTMIGRHHTPGGVDSPEFRILWDADALVNLEEVVPGKPWQQVRAIIEKWLVTEPGFRRALELYLPQQPGCGADQKTL